MNNTGIKPRKVSIDNKIASARAKRYVFYPMSNLDFAGTQPTSPIWNPKLQRARIHLLETLEYYTQGGMDTAVVLAGGGVKLELREQGTDAQVNFLMGERESMGMTSLQCLVNVDPDIVIAVEEKIYPDDKVPATLIELQNHYASLNFNEEDAVEALAKEVVALMSEGVVKAINWANSYCTSLEQEIQQSRAGKAGRPFLTPTDNYFYRQLRRPSPRDKDLNFGGGDESIASQLRDLLTQTPSNPAEVDALKEVINTQNAQLTEMRSFIESLKTKEEPDTGRGRRN
jgi:hypothetical protein